MIANKNQNKFIESSLEELKVENELLLNQLHQIERELEYYYIRNQELECGQSSGSAENTSISGTWFEDELLNIISENIRSKALAEVLKKTNELEVANALNTKLGNILIQSVESPSSLLGVPIKIGKIWFKSSRKVPPKSLGGEGFARIIAVYDDGGFDAVEKSLDDTFAPTVKANAYTALARKIMENDFTSAAEAARRAYELDPRPYRLKWLAFRLHEAGDVIEAEAMLDVLPGDINFSKSEERQASKLRSEAKHIRLQEAKKLKSLAGVSKVSRQLVEKEKENELLVLQFHQAQEEVEELYSKCQLLENKISDFEKERGRQVKLERETLELNLKFDQEKEKVEKKHLQEIATLKEAIVIKDEENETFQNLIYDELESVSVIKDTLTLKVSELIDKNDYFSRRLKEYKAQVEDLKQSLENLDVEKTNLERKTDEQSKLLIDSQEKLEHLSKKNELAENDYLKDIENLKQSLENLDVEKTALERKTDEQSKLLIDSQLKTEQLLKENELAENGFLKEVEDLKQTLKELGVEKIALESKLDEQSKLIIENEIKIEKLIQEKVLAEERFSEILKNSKQNQERLELENTALKGKKEEQFKVITDSQNKILNLTKEKEAIEVELSKELEVVKISNSKIHHEKKVLADQRDDQEKLAVERLKKLNDMSHVVHSLQASEAELEARQQMIHEEMVRSEVQIDLIKELLLSDEEQ